jgi:hypothetical protein
MERLRQVAYVSVGRAVGFAGLAIVTVMVGLSFDPLLALRSGGVLLLLLLAGLLMKFQSLAFTDYRRTEAWLLLEPGERPDEQTASRAVVSALRDACLQFARWTAGVAVLVWASAVVLAASGVGAALAG